MTDSDNSTLAGEYVLGLLAGAARLDAERRLVSDAAFAREVEGWRSRFAAFDDATDPQPAGDELWRKIEAGAPGVAMRTKAAPGSFARFWNNLAALRATALGASLATLILAVGLGFAIRAATQQPVWSRCCSTAIAPAPWCTPSPTAASC